MKRLLQISMMALGLIVMSATGSFAQIINGDFESWTDEMPDGWTTIESGIDVSEETEITHGGAASAQFDVLTMSQGDTDFRQSVEVIAGTTYNVSLWVYQAGGTARARLYVADYQGYSDPEVIGSWQEMTYEYTATESGSIEVGLRFYDLDGFTDSETIYVDDFVMEANASEEPNIIITAPEEGAMLQSTDITVETVVQNFTVSAVDGDGSIGYLVDGMTGGSFDLAFAINGLSEGDHELILTLLDNNGIPVMPIVADTINFNITVPTITTVNSVAELRAQEQGNIYELNAEAILTYQQDFRNQKFIQDATAGILIDDNDGIITSTYNINDGITGITGELSEYNNMLQFVPIQDAGAATSMNNVVDIPVVTLDELSSNFEEYESELVQVNDVTFNDAGMFENGTEYGITDGSPFSFRTTFYNVDYIGSDIPSTPVSFVGIPNSRQDGDHITARDFNDFATSIDEVNPHGFVMYPNPNNGTFQIENKLNLTQGIITIYDLVGKVAWQGNLNLYGGEKAELAIEGLQAGTYIFSFVEEGTQLQSAMTFVVK